MTRDHDKLKLSKYVSKILDIIATFNIDTYPCLFKITLSGVKKESKYIGVFLFKGDIIFSSFEKSTMSMSAFVNKLFNYDTASVRVICHVCG